jgi:hypothetical protein
MTPHLTESNPELDRMIKQTPPGMMHWSGTCTDPAATCEGCKHYGFEIAIRNAAGNVVSTRKCLARCALYRKYTGKVGDTLPRTTPAYKYFEAKTPANESRTEQTRAPTGIECVVVHLYGDADWSDD